MEFDRYGKTEFFASCAKGLSPVLADEARELGLSSVRQLPSGVSFRATVEQACKALMWLRTASRVTMVLERVQARDADELYEGCRAIDWGEHIGKGSTIAVFARGTNQQLRNSKFTQVRVKDAICDGLRDSLGWRPDVDASDPDLAISVNLHESKATVAIDLSGKPMHMRGYRGGHGQVEAPIRETLAAAILLQAGWKRIAQERGGFVDPFCGGGTLAIEAAMIAGDVAPGISRQRWGIEGWKRFDPTVLERIVQDADERAEAGIADLPPIYASDIDEAAVAVAKTNAKRAGFAGKIDIRCSDVASLRIEGLPQTGLVASNPPYGDRIMSRSQLPSLMTAFASFCNSCGSGWTKAVITPDPDVDSFVGTSPSSCIDTFNGPIEASIRVYGAGSARAGDVERDAAGGARSDGAQANAEPGSDTGRDAGSKPGRDGKAPADGEAAATGMQAADGQAADGEQVAGRNPIDAQAEEFSNRLRKCRKHRGKWARRTDTGCYRVYDSDLPDFAISVDIYTGAGPDEGHRWAYVCEYAPPKTVDTEVASARLAKAVNIVREEFELGAADVFVKRRVKSKGGSQYADSSASGAGRSGTGAGGGRERHGSQAQPRMHVVEEAGSFFQVSFDQKLDTGLFLDTRPVRERIRVSSQGKSFLNLFAYTGTATVAAAAGGASSTLTVDMSQTYLEWARRNMELNGFEGQSHGYERADVTRWITETRHSPRRFDLVYVDPPTFSNSKKMGSRSWDVQRDHVELLIGVSRILSRDGLAIFCCNLRSFKPDIDALSHAGVELEDITASTIPEDFARNPKVHHCYIVRRV